MIAAEVTIVDSAYWLARLREEFPGIGFVFTGSRWIAVRGRTWTLAAANAIELYDRLIAGRSPHKG